MSTVAFLDPWEYSGPTVVVEACSRCGALIQLPTPLDPEPKGRELHTDWHAQVDALAVRVAEVSL